MARHRGNKWGARDLGMPGRKTWEREARKRLAAKRKNPWTHGVLGLGDTRAAPGLADAMRMRDAERDRYNYLKDAVAAAEAGASLREIVALTHAAARIRKLTKAEATRIVVARRPGRARTNPDRPRILWFLVAGQHWITATARGSESVGDALHRSYLASTGYARTNLQVTKPDGFTPGEWLGVIAKHAVYKPQHTRANPPRDPVFVGAFDDDGPKVSSRYADGDTAAVASPYKKGTWEVWIFGTIDPAVGDSWNLAEKNLSRGAAIGRATELTKF